MASSKFPSRPEAGYSFVGSTIRLEGFLRFSGALSAHHFSLNAKIPRMRQAPINQHVRALLSAVDRASVALSEAVQARNAIMRAMESRDRGPAVKKGGKRK